MNGISDACFGRRSKPEITDFFFQLHLRQRIRNISNPKLEGFGHLENANGNNMCTQDLSECELRRQSYYTLLNTCCPHTHCKIISGSTHTLQDYFWIEMQIAEASFHTHKLQTHLRIEMYAAGQKSIARLCLRCR